MTTAQSTAKTLTNWVGTSHAAVTPETYISGSRETRTHKRVRRLFSRQGPHPAGWLPLFQGQDDHDRKRFAMRSSMKAHGIARAECVERSESEQCNEPDPFASAKKHDGIPTCFVSRKKSQLVDVLGWFGSGAYMLKNKRRAEGCSTLAAQPQIRSNARYLSLVQ